MCAGDSTTCCIDPTACNQFAGGCTNGYDCCTYPEENFDCDGNCIAEVDCFGVCGGTDFDQGCGCGVYDQLPTDGCDNTCGSILELDECGICGGNGVDSNNCCGDDLGPGGESPDCEGVCGGPACNNTCGTCTNPCNSGGNDLEDCNGGCDTFDDVCTNTYSSNWQDTGMCCNCFDDNWDSCGVCGGS